MEQDSTALPRLELDRAALGRQRQQLMRALFGPEFERPLEPETRQLQHYELQHELGRGAMGVVYAAHDQRLDRQVAIKTLAFANDPELRRRLVIEAQAMAKLAHPNVVPVYEIGEVEGATFIVMALVEGVSLRTWLSREARSVEQIVEVFVAAGRGLAAAHRKGIVHRDFKPDNVMVGVDGRVQVMDFGVARSAEPLPGSADTRASPSSAALELTQPALTHAGALVGTPAYMAPEQLRGTAADAASDQFAFCVSLYEALFEARPFRGRDLGELREALEHAALHLPSERPLPAWLRSALARGLARDPRQRFASMDALLDALDPTTHTAPRYLFVAHASADLLAALPPCQVLLDAGVRCWLRQWEQPEHAPIALREAPALLLFGGPHGWPLQLREVIDARLAADPSSVWSVALPDAPGERPANWPAPLQLDADPSARAAQLRALALRMGVDGARETWLNEEAERAGLEPDAMSPYRGLQAFGPDDARWMFGREGEVEQLCARLAKPEASRFVCVVGASGSGKSSLVRAGLWPALRAGALGPDLRWRIVQLRPGKRPLLALARALLELEAGETSSSQALAAQLAADPRLLAARLHALAQDQPERRALFVVDQLEELFSLAMLGREAEDGTEDPEAAIFVEALVRATRSPAAQAWVVATLRADFVPRCLEQRTLARVLHAGTYLALPPMSKAQVRAAIELPARRVGYELEAPLVAELVAAAADQPGRLPLLQHLLRELWQRRDPQARRLRLRDYEAAGGLEGAIATAANTALEALRTEIGERAEPCVRRVMSRLVHSSVGTQGAVRRRATRAELGEDPDTDRMLARFVGEARVLVASRVGGIEYIELAHEALLREWSLLREWLEADREALALRDTLAAAAASYARHEHPEYLWGSARVEEAERVLAASSSSLAASERAFLERSRTRAREGERRTRAAVAAAMLVLLALTALTASLALRYRQQLREMQRLVAAEQDQRARVEAGLSAQRGLQASLLAGGRMDLEPLLLAIEAMGPTGSAAPPEAYRGILDALAMDAVLGPRARLEGHSRDLSALALSPDGQLLATASLDGSARLWDVQSGRLLTTLEDHGGPVSALAFSPTRPLLATASWDQHARLWELPSGRLLATLAGHDDELTAITFAANGQRLATASLDASARVWSVAAQPSAAPNRIARPTFELRGHGAKLIHLEFSPNGERLATASHDATARVWDMRSGALLHTLSGHESRVLGVRFSPDNQALLSYGYEPSARLWSVESGAPLHTLEGHRSSIVAAAFAPDGETLATASLDDSARLWARESGELLARFEGHSDDLLDLAFAREGDWLLTASADASIRLWSTREGETLATARAHREAVLQLAVHESKGNEALHFASASSDDDARLWTLAGTAQGSHVREIDASEGPIRALAYAQAGLISAADTRVSVWDPRSGSLRRALADHGGELLALALSPDGQLLASAGSDASVRLWNPHTGELLATFEGHAGPVGALAFSPEGSTLASGDELGGVRLWGVRTRTLVATLSGHQKRVSALAFSPDGRRLGSASEDGDARLWDAELGVAQALLRGHTQPVHAIAFSPEGSTLATAGADASVYLWSATMGSQRARLSAHEGPVLALAFSPSSSMLATASADGSARLWGPEGEPLHRLRGHGDAVLAIAFSPSGSTLATASHDDSVRLWAARDARLLGTLDSPGDPSALAFSPDGAYLATATATGQLRQWPLPATALRLACERIAPFELGTRAARSCTY